MKIQIPILFYHKINYPPREAKIKGLYVTPFSFHWQMKYLKWRGYNSVNLDELYEGLHGQRKLPKKPIVITFDDGYKDNYCYAFPILKRFGFRATIFVITRDIGGTSGWEDSEETIEEPLLSWDEIEEMHSEGMDIQAHTHTHVDLDKLDDERVEAELKTSKRILEERLGKKINFLCYPNGVFDERIKEITKKCGYLGAITTKRGTVTENSDWFALRRIGIKRKHQLWRFAKYVEYKYKNSKIKMQNEILMPTDRHTPT